MGPRREPVTYWFAVGESAHHQQGLNSAWSKMKMGLTGEIPDGFCSFRVSSIDPVPAKCVLDAGRLRSRLRSSCPGPPA